MALNNNDEVLKMAMLVFPELQRKIIYRVSDIKPDAGGSLPPDCWYISYSASDKHCANQMMNSRLIAISKVTGEIMFNG